MILSLLSDRRLWLALAFLLVVGGAYGKGRLDQSRIAEIKAQEVQLDLRDSKIENLTRSIKINAEALESAVIRAQDREAEQSNLEQKVKDYEAQLGQADACILTDDDVSRLQNIR
ncbi:hypothetical protein FDK21_19450 [Cohaesibacter sp. CAU 1516]|uniref:hypothetical protein n=1 Tax=Cohaesibacter sp. CAU 1516 TaxID=2576038 RepID=UPI0010FF24CC|nr:hypothetical protein [Cohaesibacter sp. CAU 1516]TLP42691.1 hypothetical protein FDK21_19450 [Cohaesibacter sp. CAU 1516]